MEGFNNVNSMIRNLAKSRLKKGDTVVDATLGNGNDISFLKKLIGEEGLAYGFDIQELAIENTRTRLEKEGKLENTVLVCEGHENIEKYVEREVEFAVFNLGYLPKGDHSLVTKPKTTIDAINQLLKILKPGGLIAIASYIGHDGGMEEYQGLIDFVSGIEQREFNVFKSEFLNQKNNPPRLVVIEKR